MQFIAPSFFFLFTMNYILHLTGSGKRKEKNTILQYMWNFCSTLKCLYFVRIIILSQIAQLITGDMHEFRITSLRMIMVCLDVSACLDQRPHPIFTGKHSLKKFIIFFRSEFRFWILSHWPLINILYEHLYFSNINIVI